MAKDLNCRKCGQCNKKGKPGVTKESKMCLIRRGLLKNYTSIFDKYRNKKLFGD